MNIQPFNSSLGLKATSGGQTFNLNSPQLRLFSYDGTGLKSISRLSQKSAGQRGDTDLGYSQDARFLSAIWQIVSNGLPQYYATARATLLQCFIPREFDSIQLVFDVPGVGLRAIDVNLQGDFDFLANDRIYTVQNVIAQLKASDPRFYHPTAVQVTLIPLATDDGWGIADTAGNDGWMIAATAGNDGWSIGRSLADVTTTIIYAAGDYLAAPEYPIINIYGPVTNPVVTNLTTGERIALSGYTISSGNFVAIDLAGGPFHDASPTIRDQDGASVEQYLTSDSDLNTWHFAPAGELLFDGTRSTGSNVVRLEGSGGNQSTKIEFIYYNRYRGF